MQQVIPGDQILQVPYLMEMQVLILQQLSAARRETGAGGILQAFAGLFFEGDVLAKSHSDGVSCLVPCQKGMLCVIMLPVLAAN